jgi:hypothetical protein
MSLDELSQQSSRLGICDWRSIFDHITPCADTERRHAATSGSHAIETKQSVRPGDDINLRGSDGPER